MKQITRFAILAVSCTLWAGSTCAQGNRMYFVSLVEQNLDTAQTQVILAWNPIEAVLPENLTGFRLYRRLPPADFALLAETSRTLMSLPELTALFNEPGEGARFADIEQWAINDTEGAVMGNDTIPYLHGKLSLGPGDPNYNELEVFMLTRYSVDVSRALGLAYIDRTVTPPGVYEYMITGLVGAQETLPLGKITVDTADETILPAPTGFEQSFVRECGPIQGGIDDRRVHLKWDISPAPEDLPQKILTYGYDVFRSETDMGPLDLRMLRNSGGVPEGLIHIADDQPIIAAGPPPDEGLDNYLAIDQGDPFEFDYLQRGRTYFYYLVGKDLSGNYSETTGPLMAMVPDTMPPPVPWNFRVEEVKDDADPSIPRLQLVWDDLTPSNYWRKYGSDRQLVDPPEYAAPFELYWVPQNEEAIPRNYREVDLEYVTYRLFRFKTQEEAQQWGSDSDGDLWPDNIEDASGTDPCDAGSLPGAVPPQLVAEVDLGDPDHFRTLPNGVVQGYFKEVEGFSVEQDVIEWYKIQAIDSFGNQSPLSPPVRALLPDREQPDVDAGIFEEFCQYSVSVRPNCQESSVARIVANDPTRSNAAEGGFARLYEVCVQGGSEEEFFILQRPILNGVAEFLLSDLENVTNCQSLCGSASVGSYILKYYDSEGNLLAVSAPYQTVLCDIAIVDCFDLNEDCRRREVPPPVVIPPEDGEVCVNLLAGQRARIFYQQGGSMTPYITILADHEAGVEQYCEPIDLEGIVPSYTCFGVRVFSENNVGSSLYYLGCVGLGEESGNGPQTPLMNSVDPSGSEESPTFTVRWAAQEQGLSAFVLAYKSGSVIRYETLFLQSLDLSFSNGLYTTTVDLDPNTDLNKEWCFEVRAIDKILQSSGWSQPMCDTWEPEEGPFLGWPPVPNIPDGEGITAVWLNFAANPQPMLILSGDLTSEILDEECETGGFSPCGTGQQTCLGPTTFRCAGICSVIEAANRYGQFIVYRQEIGKDFVQVSPLIDDIYCWRTTFNVDNRNFEGLDDPFIYLTQPDENIIFPPELRPLADGVRLVFADSYPVRIGSVIRYCVVQVDPNTGEGIAMHYSEPLQVP